MLEYTGFTFCPRCGKRALSAINGNAFHCAACAFEYYHNCASGVAAIIVVKGDIVLTVRNHAPKKGKLDLPGGFCNYGESLEEALKRELREEINLSLADISYFGSFPNVYRYKTVSYMTTDVVFTCTAPDLSKASTSAEIANIRIANPHTIDLASVGFHSTKAALAKFCLLHKQRR
jgi:NADH pyrophosphatase NudC (nudix superfamily)